MFNIEASRAWADAIRHWNLRRCTPWATNSGPNVSTVAPTGSDALQGGWAARAATSLVALVDEPLHSAFHTKIATTIKAHIAIRIMRSAQSPSRFCLSERSQHLFVYRLHRWEVPVINAVAELALNQRVGVLQRSE